MENKQINDFSKKALEIKYNIELSEYIDTVDQWILKRGKNSISKMYMVASKKTNGTIMVRGLIDATNGEVELQIKTLLEGRRDLSMRERKLIYYSI